jgi:hypothetical protein
LKGESLVMVEGAVEMDNSEERKSVVVVTGAVTKVAS